MIKRGEESNKERNEGKMMMEEEERIKGEKGRDRRRET